jgi:hypothetical protein
MRYVLTASALLGLWLCGCAHVQRRPGAADRANSRERTGSRLHTPLSNRSALRARRNEGGFGHIAARPVPKPDIAPEGTGEAFHAVVNSPQRPAPALTNHSAGSAETPTPVIIGKASRQPASQRQPLFYFYVSLGVAFAVWLALALSAKLLGGTSGESTVAHYAGHRRRRNRGHPK